MDDAELLQAFDTQIRRRPESLPGFQAELLDDPAPVLRMTPTGADAAWGGGVFWCDLDESTADAAIAAAVEWFGPRGREFEWKHYAYDRPADLPDRLRAAGFEPDEEEALIVGEVAVVRDRLAAAPQPEGITVRRLRDDPEGAAADWQGINDLGRAVWDEDTTDMHRADRRCHRRRPAGHLDVARGGRRRHRRLRGAGQLPRGHRLRVAVGRQHPRGVPRPRHLQGPGVAGGRTRRPSAASGSCRSTPRRTAGRSSSGSGCAR